MNGSTFSRWLNFLSVFGLMVLLLSGCPPDFSDANECTSDADCFPDETCSMQGVCVLGSGAAEQPEITSFEADPAQVSSGGEVTLSWETINATSGTLAGGDFSLNIAEANIAKGSATVSSITQETTFTLTVNRGSRKDVETLTVTLAPEEDAPVIDSFEADEATVDAGAEVILTWSASGATSGEVRGGATPYDIPADDLESGSLAVTLTQDTTFTLEMTNATGSVTQQVMVAVNAATAPTIESFTASRAEVASGDEVTLSWATTNADSIAITNDVNATSVDVPAGSLDAGSASVTVTADTTYTLTATNAAGDVTAQASVTLLAAPVINAFNASQEMDVAPNAQLTLTWNVSGADSIAITDDAGAMIATSTMASGSVTVTFTQAVTYTLTATNAAGDVTQTLDITALSAPVVNSFTASQDTGVTPGTVITLSWDVSPASQIEIKDSTNAVLSSSSMSNGSVGVLVNQDETYTLTATNATGSDTATLMVAVALPGAPTVNSFTASQTTDVPRDTNITLSWDVSDATTIEIKDASNTTVATSTMATGSVSVLFTGVNTYTLTATNPSGSANANITVNELADPVVNSFTASQTSGITPNTNITLSWDVSGADNIEIKDSSNTTLTTSAMATGSIMVTVAADETYTLTATNANATPVSAMVSVTVTAATPTINSFTASASEVATGGMVTLSWDVSGVDGIEITDSSSTSITTSTALTGSATVTVSADETYTLTATDSASGNMTTATVMVTAVEVPVINSFAASQTTGIASGTDVTFSWDVTSPSTITITDSAATTLHTTTTLTGMVDLTISADETYTLTATNAAGMDTESIAVTIAPLPVINSFTLDQASVSGGERVTLSWTTTGADTLTLTDTQGDVSETILLADIASGMLTVGAQVSTTYTLTATSAGGSVMQTVNITVSPAQLLITEIFYDAVGVDDDLEWVEIYNTGDTFVDLKYYSLGIAGADYTAKTYQLTGMLAPKTVAVVGGPTGDATNGAPSFTQADSFLPGGIPNGGVSADGVALFFLKATDILATSVPLDNVLYGDGNGKNLIGESGSSDLEVSSNVSMEGLSLSRAFDTGDLFLERLPAPNTPVFVLAVSPTSGPDESTDTFTVSGYGFDPALDTFKLGTNDVSCTALTPTQLECTLQQPVTSVGTMDFTATRTNTYVPDASGAPMLSPLPLAQQGVATLEQAMFLEGRIPDTGADFYCAILDPVVPTALANAPITMQADVFIQGQTEAGNSLSANLRVQLGYVARTSIPYEVFGVDWFDYDSQMTNALNTNNTVFAANVTASTPQLAQAIARVSLDSGDNWTYCDAVSQNGSDDGFQSGPPVEWQ